MQQVYMVIIVYHDRSVLLESVFANPVAAELRCVKLRNSFRDLGSSRIDFVYVSQPYSVFD